MITANNMPNVGTYTLQLKYNTNELTYVGFDNISNAFNSAIASESANVTVSTYSGTITIKYPTETDKQNWSGILGGIKFNFREGIKTSTVQMTVLKNNY